MRILFDQGTPVPLRHAFAGYMVETAYELGWASLQNGELITKAEAAGFKIFVTTDKNLKYQQNLTGRKLSIVVLQTTSWPRIQKVIPRVVSAIQAATQGSYTEVQVE